MARLHQLAHGYEQERAPMSGAPASPARLHGRFYRAILWRLGLTSVEPAEPHRVDRRV